MSSVTIPLPDWSFIIDILVFLYGGLMAWFNWRHKKHEMELSRINAELIGMSKRSDPQIPPPGVGCPSGQVIQRNVQETPTSTQMGIPK